MSWFKNIRRRRFQEQELDAELRFHIDRQIDDLVRDGLTRDEARRRVQLEFGELELTKDECRDVRPLRWLDDLLRDIPLGFRALARDRLFAISVTAILGIGIATSVTMFSVLNAVALRPLPYARPGELATVNTHLMVQNRWDGTSMANLVDWRDQSKTFASMTFFRRTAVTQVTFAGFDAPQRAQEGLVGPEFFELLGTPALAGRTFSRQEFERRDRVVVLSEGLWHERFAGSESAIGGKFTVAGEEHVIRFAGDAAPSLAAVRSELRAIDPTVPFTQMFTANGRLSEQLDGRRFEAQLLGVFAAIAMLLAGAGLYALLAYQVALRTREIGIRSALGARRDAIVGLFLWRGLRLAAAGAVVGIGGAVSVARMLQSLLYETPAINLPGYLTAAACMVAVAALAAYVPARRAANVSAIIALRQE